MISFLFVISEISRITLRWERKCFKWGKRMFISFNYTYVFCAENQGRHLVLRTPRVHARASKFYSFMSVLVKSTRWYCTKVLVRFICHNNIPSELYTWYNILYFILTHAYFTTACENIFNFFKFEPFCKINGLQ